MRREFVCPAVLITSSVAAGWIAWSGIALLLPVSFLFPVLWSITADRRIAALISAGYFLAASRGLPLGVASFYHSDIWPGLLLWVCASVSFITVHTIFWTADSRTRPFRYLAALVLMAIPPFGISGWAHPITGAGILFPWWGWWGIAAMTASLMGLVTRIRPAVAIALIGFWLWSTVSWSEPKVPPSWKGVDLALGASLGRDGGLDRQRDLIARAQSAIAAGAQIIVLPESALGNWTPTVERLWTNALYQTSSAAVAGATVITGDGYDNVLVAISAERGRVLYRERMPVPGSMWQPWRRWLGQSGGARADFFANPVADLGGLRVAPLICYEQLIVWPVLQSMLRDPDLMIAIGNGWWTAGTSVVDIQRASAVAWARLFAKPLVISFNT